MRMQRRNQNTNHAERYQQCEHRSLTFRLVVDVCVVSLVRAPEIEPSSRNIRTTHRSIPDLTLFLKTTTNTTIRTAAVLQIQFSEESDDFA